MSRNGGVAGIVDKTDIDTLIQEISFKEANSIGDKILVLVSGTNGTLLAALVSTYGIYLITSLLYADPWHMFHSFPQFIGIAPSFTNIIGTYAFCNLHDVCMLLFHTYNLFCPTADHFILLKPSSLGNKR